MLIIYTGNGKGKTSASVGQAIRALGQNFHVGFAQFMKKDTGAGEQQLLRQLLGENFLPGGAGFFTAESDRPRHAAAAAHTLRWAMNWLAAPCPAPLTERAEHLPEQLPKRLLVLDEALYALHYKLLDQGDIEQIIQAAHKADCHLVLSGRGLPDWLENKADLVTEMAERKHPATRGVAAQAGIEY